MADLRISELAALAGGNLASGDLLPIVDVSASETKKITVVDLVGNATTLIADATIPGAKILFGTSQVPGTALINSGVSTSKLADDAITAAKLADESSVDLVTTLPATGAFIGQLALDTDDLKFYCWDGSVWQSIKAAGSINTIIGSGSGIVNVTVTSSGDTVSIATTLDNTSAAGQFLGGPASGAGAVSYRTLTGTDLPTATTTAKGGVVVNGNGLAMSGDTITINNTVTAETNIHHVVQYDSKGLVTAGRAITGADLPLATGGSVGAIRPDADLTVSGAGVLTHTNAVTAGTATKITFDSKGHVTAGTNLVAADIPEIPASKITSGSLAVSLLANNSIEGTKLANASTVKFGGAGSTAGVVTFPTPEFQGQYFFDALNGDLYLYDGSAWQPITITAGELIYAGTYNAALNQVKSLTAAGTAAGLVVGGALPASSNNNLRYYLVVSDSGTGTAPAPAVALAPPDMIVSNGNAWELIDVSNGIAGQLASNISFTPYGGVAATNVQTAIQELEDDKLDKAGGTITGNLEIGSAGSLTFEGVTPNANETTLAVVDPTADRTITLPDASGTVVLSGAIVNADINASAAIVDTKLATISTAGKVSNSATTATSANTASAIVARDGSGNFSASQISSTGELIGTTTALTNVYSIASALTPAVQIQGSTGNAAALSITRNTSAAANLILQRGVTGTPVADADAVGQVNFNGFDGTNYFNAALIRGVVDGTPGTGSMPGRLSFQTTPTGSTTPVERLRIDSTGQIQAAVLGTAAAPIYSFVGNTNTGIYSPGADQVAISTNSSQRLLIDSAGNVGVGISPSYKFDIAGALRFRGQGYLYDSAGTSQLIRFTELGARDARMDAFNGTDFNGTLRYAGANLVFETGTGASVTERLRITSAGLVGIGTSSPARTLHVVGRSQFQPATGTSVITLVNTSGGDGSIGVSGGATSMNYGFSTYSTADALYIQNDGKVGIGTTSPADKLHVDGGSIRITGTNPQYVQAVGINLNLNTDNQNIIFSRNASEMARFDSSSRLLVGTSTARSNFYNTNYGSTVQIEGAGNGANAPRLSIVSNTNSSADGPTFILAKANGTTVGSTTVVVNNDYLGGVSFQGSDGTEFCSSASIAAFVDGTPGADDMPGRLVFSTTADGASSPTERIRINNAGYALFFGANVLNLASSASAGTSFVLIDASYSATAVGTGTRSFIVYNNGNVLNTNNSYGALSDIKLKENIVDANSQWNDLKALQVRKYNFKEGQTHTQIGLVAQEAELVSPGLVYESPDRDAEGNDLGTVTKSVNYSVLYMKAVKALQEAMKRIEALEADVAQLKGA